MDRQTMRKLSQTNSLPSQLIFSAQPTPIHGQTVSQDATEEGTDGNWSSATIIIIIKSTEWNALPELLLLLLLLASASPILLLLFPIYRIKTRPLQKFRPIPNVGHSVFEDTHPHYIIVAWLGQSTIEV